MTGFFQTAPARPTSHNQARRPARAPWGATLAACLGLGMGLGLAAPAVAFDPGAMTAGERAAFNAAVRSYMLENPQILMEMVSAMEQREQVSAAATDRTRLRAEAGALYEDTASWVGGNLDGDITVVEFMDYRCGYCRRAHPEVKDLIATDGNIRLIVKEFPILGPESEVLSRYAVAVLQKAGDAAYAKAREALITLQGPASDAALEEISASIGVDHPQIKAHMDSPDVTRVIDTNRALATRLDINGTPTFVIDQVMVRGYVPLVGMTQIVAEQRANN